jgi:hypothetical protein
MPWDAPVTSAVFPESENGTQGIPVGGDAD